MKHNSTDLQYRKLNLERADIRDNQLHIRHLPPTNHHPLHIRRDTILLRYTIKGDTTINEIVYNKLCLVSGDTINPRIRAIGGIREENKKIYYIGETILANTYDEFLLYDFTKEIGDTIYHESNGGFFYSVVLDIDSIMIDDNYRKRFKIQSHSFGQSPDFIIEGVGSVVNGLLGNISDITTCGTHHWEHICFKENGEVKYLNSNFDDCFPFNLLMVANITKLETKIKIYPNPIDQNLQIENNTNENLNIKIIDINGRSIIEQSLNKTKTIIKLDVRSGIYNALITNKIGQIVLTQKIIKQ
ncbi:MAG: T9SS type A sorting domain-containing protein [Sphingobacteriia bacterium]|nr:T9SS type A sorting domain-containing protein [Sphingobacteriia bacterium]